MNKNMMNNIGLLGIIVLMITMLIACDSESGGDTTQPPVGTSNLYAWGLNSNGQLGIGNQNSQNTPVPIGTKTWTQVSVGASIDPNTGLPSGFTIAIDNTGHLYAWGENSKGQLGNGSTTDSLTPVQIGTKTWTQVSAGDSYTVAIDIAGKLYAWGENGAGKLGIGTETVDGSEVLVDKYEPVPVGDGTKTWKQVSAGTEHTVAIDSDNHLFTWGNNNFGQLGIGTETVNGSEVLVDKYEPVPVGDGTKTWTQVSAGMALSGGILTGYTIAIDSNGRLYAWGGNGFGQFGNGSTTESTTPVAIEPTKTWTQVSAGYNYSIAIDNADHLYAWGWNAYGQLGIGTETVNGSEVLVDKHEPVPVGDGNKTWKQVSAGRTYVIAIDNADHLYAWGENSFGQFGNGNNTNQNTPVAIEPTKTWTQVSTEVSHTLGIIQESVSDTP